MGDTMLIRAAVTDAAIVAVGVVAGVLGSPLAGVIVAVIGLVGLGQRLRASRRVARKSASSWANVAP